MFSKTARESLAASNARIVITGASGWFGRATIEMLADALGPQFKDRVACFGSSSRVLEINSSLTVEQRALSEMATLPSTPTWVFHFAYLTKDRAEAMTEAEYVTANRAISASVIDSLGAIGAEVVFVASSGAASVADDPRSAPAMALYGKMKRDDEDAFATWADTHQQTAVIARVFNVSGPHINKHGAYALASLILDALAGRPPTVKSPRSVMRGFVAMRELMSLVICLMADPKGTVTRFDSGGDPVELGALARMIADVLNAPGWVRAEITEIAGDVYLGDDAAYQALRAAHGVPSVSLPDQILETAAFLRNGMAA